MFIVVKNWRLSSLSRSKVLFLSLSS